ncbi:type IA DNA topoisomerase, partial [Halalkalibacterium ligniniphilum]
YLEDEALEKVLMQTEGLGTEATRAGIISILKDRGYIQVTKNQVYATEKGQLLIEALGDSVLTSPEMTAKWEQRLLEIGRGEADPKRFMEQVKKLSQHLIEEAYERSKAWDFSSFDTSSIQRQTKRKSKGGAIVGTCKSCGGSLLDRGAFYGCAEYRKKGCTFTISKMILGKKISQANVKRLLIEGKTNVIKGFKKGEKTFQAALAWDEKKGGLTFLFEDKKDTST